MSEPHLPARRASRQHLWLYLFTALVGLYCAWVLSLPVFPSQDGPMHLYLAHIMSLLLSHASPVYEHYYYIQHLLPPYSLYYYLLIGMSKIVPMLWADKLVVVLALACFCFGIRYLITARRPAGESISLLIFPVALCWPFFMGFVNFMLSLGLGAWALGVWTRLEERPSTRGRVIFAVLLAAMTLTHPVPVGLVLLYCSADLVFRVWDRWRARRAQPEFVLWDREWNFDLFTMLATGLACVLYVSAFTVNNVMRQGVQVPTFARSVLEMFQGQGLVIMSGLHGWRLIYRLLNVIPFIICLGIAVLAVVRALRSGAPRRFPRWLFFSLLVLIAYPIIPPDLNGSHFFRVRLLIVAWIAIFAAASELPALPRRAQVGLAVYGVLSAALVLFALNKYIRPVANDIATITREPLGDHGLRGLLLPAYDETYDKRLLFDPYVWASAHRMRRANGVLVDTPWLNLPIIPVHARTGTLNGLVPSPSIDVIDILRKDLAHSATERAVVFPMADYVMLVDRQSINAASPLDEVLASDAHDSWSCKQHGWYVLCDREPKAGTSPAAGSGHSRSTATSPAVQEPPA